MKRHGQFVEPRLAGCLTSVMGVDFTDQTANGPVISTRNYHDSRDKGRRRPQTLVLTSICKRGKRKKREQPGGTSRRTSNDIHRCHDFCFLLSVYGSRHVSRTFRVVVATKSVVYGHPGYIVLDSKPFSRHYK